MPRPVLCKRDPAQESDVQKWIIAVLGEDVFQGVPYEEALKDGIILCRVMNTLSPGSIPKINTSGSNFKLMENVTRFQQAIINYGVHKADIFQTNDLSEKKDLANVTNTMFALGRAAQKHADWTGPQLAAD